MPLGGMGATALLPRGGAPVRPRIRTVKPEFFQHGELYDAEIAEGLPLRLAFAGLWCLADREGRFEWKPRELKLHIVPYDQVEFARVLDALEACGFIVRYTVADGRTYGWIPNFTRHQVVNNREEQSRIPAPPTEAVTAYHESELTRASRVPRAYPMPHEGNWKGTGTGRERESQLLGGASRRAETHGHDNGGELTFRDLMELVHQHFYAPDGRPPEIVVKGRPWTEARDGSILKQILRQRSARDVAIAIEGVALLRDYPGIYADAVDWLRPAEKMTLRALYNSSSGVLPMFAIATQAYWKHANSRQDAQDKAPVRAGDVLRQAITHDEGLRQAVTRDKDRR
jgi:hypothetical protein